MPNQRSRAGRALAVAVVVLAAAHCAEKDPWARLATARAAHEVEVLSWTEGRSLDSEEGRDALISIRVTSGRSLLVLPCLTVDIVFEAGSGEEIGRVTRAIDLEGIEDAGGAIETVLRVPLPDSEQPVEALGVTPSPVTAGELPSLCEAKAVRAGAS